MFSGSESGASGLALRRVALRIGSHANREGQIERVAIYYRGALSEHGSAIEGRYDFRFLLHEEVGRVLPVLRRGVWVVRGIFSLVVDFAGVEGMRNLHLSVGVRRSAVPREALSLFPQERLWP